MPQSSLDRLPEPGIVLSPDGRVTAANDLAAAMFGSAAWLMDQPSPRALGNIEPLTEWLADDHGPPIRRHRLEALRENHVPIVIDLSARRTGDGEARHAVCVMRELREDRLAGEAQRYFDAAFEHAPIGMGLFNTDGQYIRVNSSLCAMLGRGPEQLIGRRDQEFTHPEDRQADVDAAWRILRGELTTWQCEKRFLRPDGSLVWAIANLTFLRSSDGLPLSWVGQFQDITQAKAHEASLRELADRDPLTCLFNRRRLEAELACRIGQGRRGSLLIVDLNHFKQINDSHGHRAGDLVLVTVASALREAVRKTDLAARVGGDEFALLIHDAGEQDARGVAAMITDVVSAQRFDFAADGSVSASVGVASFGPERSTTPSALLAAADSAMYRVKSAGSSRRRAGGLAPPALRS